MQLTFTNETDKKFFLSLVEVSLAETHTHDETQA